MSAQEFEHVTRGDASTALTAIRECEADLGYKLSEGQRRDLICDNFPSWSWQYVAQVVAAIDAKWFTSLPADAPLSDTHRPERER